MAGTVDITLPSGEGATVPQADLAQALAAGAAVTQAPKGYEAEFGGGLGQAASFALGAGRTASFGLMDGMLVEGANVVGGEQARREMLHGLNVAKETNQYATMGGEAAGLFMGAGEGVMASGAIVEEQVAAQIGKGLMGRVGSMAARGGVEGAMLGVQHQITEDTLGDHAYTAEKLVASAEKDALLGAAIGGGMGVLGHIGSEALAALRHGPGPRSAALLDHVAGVEGAGLALREEAGQAEAMVSSLQKAGATSEQAARMVDEVSTVARARTSGGPLSSLLDEGAARFAANRAGGNAELREVLEKGYADRITKLAKQGEVEDAIARKLADKGTRVMRDMEDVLNEVHFTEKGSQMAKLTDPTKWQAARDVALKSLQDADTVIGELERTASKGGQEGAVRNLRKQLTDFYAANAKVELAATAGAQQNATRDFFMRLDSLKRNVDKFAGHGQSVFGRSEASREFLDLANRMRSTLEDETVWGAAGGAQREWNSTFSLAKGRRDDFGRRFAVSIDQVSGVPVPELDAGKIKSALRQLEGAEGDQAVKTTEAFVDGLRARAAAIEKHGSMTAEQATKLSRGKEALEDFASTFGDARKEAAVLSRLRTQQLEEQGKSLGGVLGLATEIMTKPLQTMDRLGVIKATTERFENGIVNALGRFFDGKGGALMRRGTEAAEETTALMRRSTDAAEETAAIARRGAQPAEEVAVAARPREAVAKEIGDLREIAGNPPAMQERVRRMLGDLPTYAPKIADAAGATALRIMTYLAAEAPQGRADRSLLSATGAVRYSDQELSVYETKRTAAFRPESVIAEMKAGKLNRDGIRAVKATSPRIFAKMQEIARDEILRRQEAGTLAGMSYQRKATIACLLEIPPDATWTPEFMAMMQATKLPEQGQQQQPQQQAKGGGRRPIKLNSSAFETEAQQIEGRTT